MGNGRVRLFHCMVHFSPLKKQKNNAFVMKNGTHADQILLLPKEEKVRLF